MEDIETRPAIPEIPEKPKNEGKGFYLKRPRRSVSLTKNIEVLLVADYKMVEYYTNQDLENYLFTIMNMVRVAATTYVCRLRSCLPLFFQTSSLLSNFLSSFKLPLFFQTSSLLSNFISSFKLHLFFQTSSLLSNFISSFKLHLFFELPFFFQTSSLLSNFISSIPTLHNFCITTFLVQRRFFVPVGHSYFQTSKHWLICQRGSR